ncbi:helicase-associated domain-containing protein [Cellulomonas soli]|uniref:helicase-associated domain-containing protein n=1 Tax=Cellulomonas soli TaxID=931535 RepID=UPI003F83C078
MATFTGYLRSRGDDMLVELLRRRPDLAAPSPATLTSLAARSTNRTGLERALTHVDAQVLQVLETVVALGPLRRDQVLQAVGAADPADARAVTHAIDEAVALALLWPQEDTPDAPLHTSPGLAEVLGPFPAGLVPLDGTAEMPARRQAAAQPPRDPQELDALLAGAPAGARPVLDALTWGPPVGVAPPAGSPAGQAVAWLTEHGLLDQGDARHVVLPRAVALALREGRTHREPARAPSLGTEAVDRPAALVSAESTAAAERAVRLVAHLVRLWGRTPPAVLRAGGLGVRDLRRTAGLLEVEEAEAALVVELAGAAGLVADDGEETPSFVPTVLADEWAATPLPDRWARLAGVWLTTTRTPWLVGGRDERGTVVAALDPELHRPWAPRLRRSVLDVLADAPDGSAPGAERVVETLRWRTPRAVPPTAAVAAVLAEASLLGVVGAGALSPSGRALLGAGTDGAAEDATAPALPPTAPATQASSAVSVSDAAVTGATPAARALAATLPEPVDELLLQGDLTGVVPGRPTAALEDLLDRAAVVESRGGALTVRFTPASVRAALDGGSTADDLLSELATRARGGVPQALEYLVRDAARRHGRLRAGMASSYVRSDDPSLLAGLVDDPRLARLGLVQLAPTVLAAQAPTGELLDALREHGLAPVAETPDGQVVHTALTVHRVRGRVADRARRRALDGAAAPAGDPTARLASLVRRLRTAEPDGAGTSTAAGSDLSGPDGLGGSGVPAGGGTAEPAEALVLLREAAAERAQVWVELVGSQGVPQRRLLRPVVVEGGRLRAVDAEREAELTVAVHRIASVTRA